VGAPERQFLPQFLSEVAAVVEFRGSKDGVSKLSTWGAAKISSNLDGPNGEPYVNHLPGHPELFLAIPIREWDDAQAARTVGAAHR
jgi:hypothetical protein